MSTSSKQGTSNPETKKLRWSDPDLKIIVKSGGGDGEEQGPVVEKEYLKYASVMANHSGFVDATLSNPMRENETKTIILHDVTPEVFEKALEYLENPTKCRQATASDILQVVEFYDKYEFKGGIEFADEILANYFKEQPSKLPKSPKSLDFYIHAVHLAHSCNLKMSTEEGIKPLDFTSRGSTESCNLIHPRMLQERHVTMLQPLFQDKILALPACISLGSPEEIASTLFPKYFVRCLQDPLPSTTLKSFMLFFEFHNFENKLVNEGVNTTSWKVPFWTENSLIKISGVDYEMCVLKLGTNSEGCNIYDLSDSVYARGSGDWSITLYDDAVGRETCVFVSPHSAHLVNPPREPWIAMSELDSSTDSKTNEVGRMKLSDFLLSRLLPQPWIPVSAVDSKTDSSEVLAAQLGQPIFSSFEYHQVQHPTRRTQIIQSTN